MRVMVTLRTAFYVQYCTPYTEAYGPTGGVLGEASYGLAAV